MNKRTVCLLLLFCLALKIDAQNPVLSFPPNWVPSPGAPQTLPQSPTTPTPTNGYAGGLSDGPHNMYAGADGNPLFFVAGDNSAFVPASGFYSTGIYNKHGYRIANLVQNSSGDPIISQSEIAIVPDPGDCSRYYIFGSAEDYSLGGGKYYPFYTYIDMDEQTPSSAPVNEKGKLIQPANPSGGNIKNMYDADLTPNSGYITQQRPYLTGLSIAVTKPRSGDGNSRLVYIYNGYYFYVYKVTTTGVQYVAMYNLQASLTASTYGSDILHPAEMELYEDAASGKIRVAVPLADGSFSNREEIGLFEFSLSTGAYIGSSYRIFCISDECSGLSSSSNPDVTGLEFSPDGNYLYFTHTPTLAHPDPVEWLEYSNLSNWGGLTPSLITMTNYQYSQIEVGLDGKLYLPASNRVSTMNSPNSPTSYTWTNFAITQTIPLYNNAYFMPDQVDQETYGGFYTATPECCKAYSTYTIEKEFTLDIPVSGTLTIAPTSTVTGTDSQSNPMTVVFTATTTATADIIVPAGLSVTFSSVTVQFTKDAGIIVKKNPAAGQGGKLRLNNSTLTWHTGCENEFWKGVYLEGHDGVAQGSASSSPNGVLTQTNSQIDHALTAIYIEHGAIAQFNGRLYDNKVAVEASAFNPGAVLNDVSLFQGTTIKTQSSYLTALGSPSYFVGITDRRTRIRFLSCDFVNDATAYDNAYDGIIANTSACYTTGSTFTRLAFAVFHSAASAATSRLATVSSSTFNNNGVGVYIGSSNLATIGGNTNFYILDNTTIWAIPMGIWLDASSKYAISNNILRNFSLTTATTSGPGGGSGTVGIFVQNTCINDPNFVNIIERNIFSKLHAGIWNEGVNYWENPGNTPSNDRGVRYYCNNFTGGNILLYDIGITSGIIDNHQGVTNWGAQNQFSHSGSLGDLYIDVASVPTFTPAPTIGYIYNSVGPAYAPVINSPSNTIISTATTGNMDNNCSVSSVGSPGGRMFEPNENPAFWLTRIAELQGMIEEAQEEEMNPEISENIAHWSGLQDQLRTQLVAWYLDDTVTVAAMDSAYKYMLQFAHDDKRQLIEIYLDKGDVASAQETYDLLHAEQPGTPLDKYLGVKMYLHGKNTREELLNDLDLYNDVLELANDSSDPSVFLMSRTLLNTIDLTTYRPYNGTQLTGSGERKMDPMNKPGSPYKLSNYPNPFNGSTTLNAFVPKGSTSASLMITDVLGKEVAAYKLNEGANSVVFEKTEVNGLLFYTLFIDGIRKETKLMMKSGQ
ncbi:MAG: hypothetical protein K0S33_2663 [Bacteroidetes bacterium]|jgi:hypothetical protein|nr:hypothetical protein [Bacteroidota bacterium]